jgi:hypothetical protein
MKRLGISSLLVVLIAASVTLLWFSNRESAGQSPDGWRQLSLTDFISTMESLTTGDEPVSDELWTEIRSQSAERLEQHAIANSTNQANYRPVGQPLYYRGDVLQLTAAKMVRKRLGKVTGHFWNRSIHHVRPVGLKHSSHTRPSWPT